MTGIRPVASATTLDPAVRASPAALLREPLAWAALTAFVGSAVGLAGTFAWSSWEEPQLLATWGGPVGGLLAALSLLGVAHMLGRRSWAAWVGGMLLLVWLAASFIFALYSSLQPPEPNLTGAPPPAFLVLVHASFWLGSAAVLPLALGALFVARKRSLGVVLLLLSVPGRLPVLLYASQVGADNSLSQRSQRSSVP